MNKGKDGISVILLLTLLQWLCYADAIITVYGVKNGLRETNPLFQNQNLKEALIQKMGASYLGVFVTLLCYRQAKKEKSGEVLKTLKVTIFSLCVFYMMVVLWNVYCLTKI